MINPPYWHRETKDEETAQDGECSQVSGVLEADTSVSPEPENTFDLVRVKESYRRKPGPQPKEVSKTTLRRLKTGLQVLVEAGAIDDSLARKVLRYHKGTQKSCPMCGRKGHRVTNCQMFRTYKGLTSQLAP